MHFGQFNKNNSRVTIVLIQSLVMFVGSIHHDLEGAKLTTMASVSTTISQFTWSSSLLHPTSFTSSRPIVLRFSYMATKCERLSSLSFIKSESHFIPDGISDDQCAALFCIGRPANRPAFGGTVPLFLPDVPRPAKSWTGPAFCTKSDLCVVRAQFVKLGFHIGAYVYAVT